MEIPVGLKGLAQETVNEHNTAMAAGSGDLQVYGTPFMIALMEKAASESLLPYFEEGQSSVGTMLNIRHLSATPVGLQVRAESEVTRAEGKLVWFTVRAYDERGLIGEGEHERAVIGKERFLQKCCGKLNG